MEITSSEKITSAPLAAFFGSCNICILLLLFLIYLIIILLGWYLVGHPILSLNELNNRFLSIDEKVLTKHNSEIFNIGNDDLNLSIDSIYEKINSALGGSFEKNWYGEPDHRSYHVSFRKSHDLLPRIEYPKFFDEVEKISQYIHDNEIDEIKTNTLKWYQQLLKNNPDALN